MQPRKFMLILPNLKTGGVFTAAVNFCNELARNGHAVDVLVMTDDVPPENSFLPGVSILRLSGRARLWDLGKPMIANCKSHLKRLFFSVLGILKKLLNKRHLWNRFLFGQTRYFSGYDAVFAYKQGAAPYYFALHCVEAKKKMAFVHGDLSFMGDISMWQPYLREFDKVAYVSDGVKHGFIKAFPELAENAVTLYNFFNEEEIRKKSEEYDPSFSGEKITIVTVSRIENTTKGILRIPQIAKKLHERFGNTFCWYVAGDGPSLEECRRLTKQEGLDGVLIFVGEKQNPYPMIAHADFTVLPSLTEAFPMAVVESLILSVPVVVSRYPAAEEQLSDEVYGRIAEQSVDSIFETICEWMENGEVLQTFRAACAAYHYRNDKLYEQVMKACQL